MTKAVVVPEKETQEIQEITSGVVKAAEKVVVDSNEGMLEATDILSWVSNAKKQVEDKRKFLVKPLNDHVKAINEMFKGYMAPLEQADGVLRKKVLIYRQEQERIRREEEERLRKEAEAEQKRLEKQAKKEGAAPPPPPPPVAPSMPEQAKTVHSGMGSVSTKMVWDFEIVDEVKVPRNFMIVNEKAIRAAVKAGVRNIPGVKVYQKEELAVRAR
jgi:hypothetical protein